MRAPNARRASTRIRIGRCFMRSVPVMTCVPCVTDRNAVRNRMAVPAAMISITGVISCKARIMTRVSSQSERFSGWNPLPASAFIMSARLQILLEEGSWMRVCISAGGVIFIRFMLIWIVLFCRLAKVRIKSDKQKNVMMLLADVSYMLSIETTDLLFIEGQLVSSSSDRLYVYTEVGQILFQLLD